MENFVQRFLLEDLDIRGAVVRLGSVWHQLMDKRAYPEAIADLLGEMSVTTLLLADNLKQSGRLTLQLRGKSPLPLLVVDCNEQLNIRCMAQHDAEVVNVTAERLLKNAQLSLVLDAASMREPYQSIVPVVGKSVADIFEHYLEQSEQLMSRFFLVTSKQGVAGLFLQKMPMADERDADGWSRVEALASTVKAEELLNLATEDLLTRLFHEESVRLFDAHEVTHRYPQDWEKISNMLRALGRDEVYSALKDHGAIVIRDDLSNHEYRFDKAAIDALFAHTPESSSTVH